MIENHSIIKEVLRDKKSKGDWKRFGSRKPIPMQKTTKVILTRVYDEVNTTSITIDRSVDEYEYHQGGFR